MEPLSNTVTVIINKVDPLGGAEQLAIAQVREFLRQGFNARLAVLCRSRTPDDIPSDYVSMMFLPFYINQFDLIVSHLWYANTMARIAAMLTGHKNVLTFEHNMATPTFKTRKMLFFDKVLQNFSKTVAVSQGVKDALVNLGLDSSRIFVIENGIDLEKYKNAKLIDLSQYPGPVYLYVGRLMRLKGLDTLLKAYEKVGRGTLLIAGDGSERKLLEEQAKGNVVFLGARDDVPKLLKSVDCLVVPSRAEGFPMILLEGMATGVPIITTNFSSIISEVINYAKVVPVDDIPALSEAMLSIPAPGRVDLHKFSIEREINEILSLQN